MRKTCVVVVGLAAVLVAGAALAQAIPNWNAPATWTPAGGMVASAQADLGLPVPFQPVTPCRVADTRGNGFTGAYGPPALAASGTRNFTITGQCGIPSGATAVSFNFTVTNGAAAGDLRFYPAGGALPLVSTINWYAGEPPLANAAVVPLGAGGAISVKNDSTGTVHLIIDVNGYYATYTNTSQWFGVITSYGGGVVYGENTSTGGGSVSGVRGTVPNGGAGASGVLGEYGGSVAGYGVEGKSVTATNAAGVVGRDQASTPAPFNSIPYLSSGVRGESADHIGVFGFSNYAAGGFENYTSGDVLQSWAYLAYGSYSVYGLSVGGAGASSILGQYGGTVAGYGVEGLSTSYDRAAGVLGSVGGAAWSAYNTGPYGVRGIAQGGTNPTGVGGEGINQGGMFLRVNASGTLQTRGYVGAPGTDGLYTANDLTVTGTKNFVEPHPLEAGKVIKYVALEGPEAGTYFRGKGRIVGGQAVITVPENFRWVTDEEGLTVQVTPIGRSVALSVVSYDLDAIVVEANRDVEFFYLVQGVRRAFKDFKPIQTEVETFYFKPHSADEGIDMTLPAEFRLRLISTGIYNEDGTVNMNTAERLGWAQQWRDREAQMKAAAEAAAAEQHASPARAGFKEQQP